MHFAHLRLAPFDRQCDTRQGRLVQNPVGYLSVAGYSLFERGALFAHDVIVTPNAADRDKIVHVITRSQKRNGAAFSHSAYGLAWSPVYEPSKQLFTLLRVEFAFRVSYRSISTAMPDRVQLIRGEAGEPPVALSQSVGRISHILGTFPSAHVCSAGMVPARQIRVGENNKKGPSIPGEETGPNAASYRICRWRRHLSAKM